MSDLIMAIDSPDEQHELICINANICTMDPGCPSASVVAAKGRNIIYVGDDRREAETLLSSKALKVDLGGRTVVPGLYEGHAHLILEGFKLGQVELRGCSKEDVLALVRREVQNKAKGEWIVGHGWNQQHWPDEAWPDRLELDEAAPDNPVCLDRIDKHSIWVNSAAMRAAGLADNAPDPPLGEYLRRADGSLKGIIVGKAMQTVWEAIPAPDLKAETEALLKAQEELFGYGITSVMDAGVSPESIALMERAYKSGSLKLRIRGMVRAWDRSDEKFFNSGGVLRRGLYGERFTVDGVKLHADGSLGSRSAWMLRDYADRPGHRGSRNFTDEEMAAAMERANDHGFAVSVHAIGDAAVRQTLDVMERVLGPRPAGHRWRIEHFQVVEPGDLTRALAMGVVISLQTIGIMSDLEMAEERLGPEVIKHAYAWRDILNGGGIIVNGSDCPIEKVNPFQGMFAAVMRENLDGFPEGGWYPRHCLTPEEALKTYTVWPAYSEFGERRKGSLIAGKLADFAVLNQDPLTCRPSDIKDIECMMTVLGGEVVFSRL